MTFDFNKDISETAKGWMKALGDFGPTVRADSRELKGMTTDDDGDRVKTYYDSNDLRELAAACTEVAAWLDKRATQEQPQ